MLRARAAARVQRDRQDRKASKGQAGLVSVYVEVGSTKPLLTYGGISMQAGGLEEAGKAVVEVQAKGIQLKSDGTQTRTVVQSTTVNETQAVHFTVGESSTFYTLSRAEFTPEALKNYNVVASDQFTVVPAGTARCRSISTCSSTRARR